MFLRTLTVCAVVAGLSAAAAAGPVKTENKTVERQGETSLLALVEFGAGSLELHQGAPDLLLDATVTYDRRYVDVYLDSSRRSDRGILELASDVDVNGRVHKLTNEWDVGLNPEIPLELELEVGAAEARIDFTGLALTRLDMDIGAADAEVWWDSPNPERLEEITIDCGAASLHMEGLGFANFEYLDFDGGMGSFELDFTGPWSRSAEAHIDIGMGSLDLIIPEDIGVRIETDGSFLSSVDVDRHFREIDEDLYETDNYENAEIQLNIRVQIGMGSVDVRAVRR